MKKIIVMGMCNFENIGDQLMPQCGKWIIDNLIENCYAQMVALQPMSWTRQWLAFCGMISLLIMQGKII